MNMRETNSIEKLFSSAINILIVGIFFTPVLFFDTDLIAKKTIFIYLFLLYNLLVLVFNKNRCFGMIILKAQWKERYPFANQIIYVLLYTISFSTLLFWVYFPLDLFLLNMLFFQFPAVILKKTTMHGYLSGNMITVKPGP